MAASDDDINHEFWEAGGTLVGEALAAALHQQNGYRADILMGVGEIPFDGVPGQLALLSPRAFTILATGGENPTALVAAAEYGRGRIVAFAHEGLLNSENPSARALVANATAWVQRREGRPLRVEAATGDDFDAEDFQRFIARGGGALIGRCPWGWRYLNANAPLATCGYNRALLPMGLAFGDGYFAPPGGVIRPSASVDPDSAAAWVFASRLREGSGSPATSAAATAAAAAAAEVASPPEAIRVSDHALIAASGPLSDVRVPLGLAASGSTGGWWAPVGAEQHMDVQVDLPSGFARLHAIRLVCANLDACPRTVSLVRLAPGGRTEAIATWPFERGAGADKLDPVTLVLPPDALDVSSGGSGATTFRLGFHGIVNSHYIGINKVEFLAARGGRVTHAHAAAAGGAAGGAGAHPAPPSSSGLSEVPPGAHTLLAISDALPQHLHGKVASCILEAAGGFEAVPTPERPLRRTPRADLFAAAVKLAPSAIFRSHPPAFPGAAPASAPRVSVGVVAARSPGNDAVEWTSTHVYASPGDVITVEVTEGSPADWSLRIGCHSDDVSQGDQWLRWPAVTQEVALTPLLRLTATHGGPVYLQSASGAGSITARISGGVSAPHASAASGFAVVDGPAPWGELVGRHMVLTVRREYLLKHRASLAAAAALWDEIIINHRRLSPSVNGDRPERIVPDVQTSCGLMHSGYPIMVDEHTFNK